MDFKKLAEAFEEIGVREAKLSIGNRAKADRSDPEMAAIINRQLIAGNMCCHIAEAIRIATGTKNARAR